MAPAGDRQRLVLASASPRRRELLTQIGVRPDLIEPADINESPNPHELPRDHASRLAMEKVAAVSSRHAGAFILAADTVVACGRRIIPKPETHDDARACLKLLSGRRHRVFGGVCLVDPDGAMRSRLVTTAVAFKRLSAEEIEGYLNGGEWRGKAGGYAIQGRAAALVRRINGSYSNVVGLPLYEVAALLSGAGYRLWSQSTDRQDIRDA